MFHDASPRRAVTTDDIRTRMKSYSINTEVEFPVDEYPHIKRSSVLVPLFFKDGDLHVLFTLRAASLRHHASMVSLPGGRRDNSDVDDVATALRESEEEIGLRPSQTEPVGCLLPTCARPYYSIFPVVALIADDFRPTPNEQEVQFAFSVPLARFLQDDFENKETLIFGQRSFYQEFPCETERGTVKVWGATAHLCMMVACVVFQADPPISHDPSGKRGYGEYQKGMKDFYHLFCESTKPTAKL